MSARALSIQSLSLFSSSSLRLVPTGPHTRRPQVQPYAVQRPLRDGLAPISSRSQDASARQLLRRRGPILFSLSFASCPHSPALVLQGAVQYTNLGHHTLHLVLAASFYNQPPSPPLVALILSLSLLLLLFCPSSFSRDCFRYSVSVRINRHLRLVHLIESNRRLLTHLY